MRLDDGSARGSQDRSLRSSLLVAAGLGGGVLVVVLLSGVLVGGWDYSAFVASLSVGTAVEFAGVCGAVVVTFAVPAFLSLHYRLVAPLALLGVVVLAWTAVGVQSGVLAADTVFALGYYAVVFAPVYVALYVAVGVGEHYARTARD